MWRKVEEEHCAVIEDGVFKSEGSTDVQMQVLKVTNAEVECNINSINRIGLHTQKHLGVDDSGICKNQNNVECDFNFLCMDQMSSQCNIPNTNIDLDTLPSSLSNVSPDSGIQSSGDSPLRIECELPPPPQNSTIDNQTSTSLMPSDYYNRTELSDASRKHDTHTKHVSPTPSPPILTPHEPLWTNNENQLCTEKRKVLMNILHHF
ncbi:uncharacterized protein CEXT_203991 [Caerostris extrusa]|uniref:Uncharacterized protein n=1 Tax=Caerostris extrusa TaxID=172846 RepID=A0AAV4UF18_CAEEX|nr:uncharacterized protein CEXT_203991 [Caerostris extrusa]